MKNRQNSLSINALLNVTKQFFTVIFPLITFPYVSRILGVENYGKITFASSLISYFSLIAGLGVYSYAIREGARIKDNKSELCDFCNEVFTINLISTIITYFIFIVLILIVYRDSDYFLLLIVQSASIIFTTIGVDWINVIYEDYLFITIRYLICQSLSLIIMFILVKSSSNYIEYSFASIISSIMANILNIFYIKRKYNYFPQIKLSNALKKHVKPIVIIFGSSIATLIYINSDITILGILKDSIVVGYYSVAAKIYTLIKQLLNALLIVAIPRISSELVLNKVNIEKLYNKIYTSIIIVLIPVCSGLYMLSENIIRVFSGEEYVPATDSLKILAIALAFATMACFYVNIVMLPNRMEKKVFIATFLSAFINIILNFIMIPNWSQYAAALTTLISEILMLILGEYYTHNILKIKKLKPMLISLLSSLSIIIICYLSQIYIKSNILIIVASITFSIILWIIIGLITYHK